MGRCSSSTCKELLVGSEASSDRQLCVSYQEGTGDEDDDATLTVGGLGIEGVDLVLDLLEGKRLVCT